VVPFEIDRVIKGDIDRDRINVLERGAIGRKQDGSRYVVAFEQFTPLVKGSKYLLFLDQVDRDNKPYVAKGYTIGIDRGKFNIDGTDELERQHAAQRAQYRRLKSQVLQRYNSAIEAETKGVETSSTTPP